MYCLTDQVNKKIQKEFYHKDSAMSCKNITSVAARGVYPMNRISGLYVYDVSRLID